jgi:hypothetical protein
LETPVSSV